MANAIAVNQKTITEILARLDELARDVRAIKARVFAKEPPYGNDAWWEWSDKKALKSIREGKGITIRNKKELDEFFKSL